MKGTALSSLFAVINNKERQDNVIKKIKPEDLNQGKGASKKGDACHPDSEFITEEWFREEHGIELFPLHKSILNVESK